VLCRDVAYIVGVAVVVLVVLVGLCAGVGGSGWGRPSKLTPDVRDLVASFVRNGGALEVAAVVAGVHRSTVYEWQRRGRLARDRLQAGERIKASERRFVGFLDAIDQARADAEISAVMVVRDAILRQDLKAAQWYLERAHPERWARRTPDPGPSVPSPALEEREPDAQVRWVAEQLRALSPAERARLVWDATIAVVTDVDVAGELERGRQLRTAAENRALVQIEAPADEPDENGATG
jgi:hypothetical protein